MSDEKPFGLQLYEEFERRYRKDVLTGLFNYAGIQQLKAADRDAVLKLFKGSEYAFLQRLKRDSAEEIADLLITQLERKAQDLQSAVMFLAIASAAAR
jgi:hypothetical protein